MNKNTLRKIAADIAGKVEHDFVEPIKPKTVVIIILPPKRNISIFATSPHPEVSLTILVVNGIIAIKILHINDNIIEIDNLIRLFLFFSYLFYDYFLYIVLLFDYKESI